MLYYQHMFTFFFTPPGHFLFAPIELLRRHKAYMTESALEGAEGAAELMLAGLSKFDIPLSGYLNKWLSVLGLVAYYNGIDCSNPVAVAKYPSQLSSGLSDVVLRIRPDRKPEKPSDVSGEAQLLVKPSLVSSDGTVSALDLLDIMLDSRQQTEQCYELSYDEMGISGTLAELVRGRGFNAFRYQSSNRLVFTDIADVNDSTTMGDDGSTHEALLDEPSLAQMYHDSVDLFDEGEGEQVDDDDADFPLHFDSQNYDTEWCDDL
jgi:hypothetical protein